MDNVQVIQSIGDAKAGIYALCYMRVCAHKDATDGEILRVCNEQNPSGTTNGWGTVVRKDSEPWTGAVQCADDESRQHIIVLC